MAAHCVIPQRRVYCCPAYGVGTGIYSRTIRDISFPYRPANDMLGNAFGGQANLSQTPGDTALGACLGSPAHGNPATGRAFGSRRRIGTDQSFVGLVSPASEACLSAR